MNVHKRSSLNLVIDLDKDRISICSIKLFVKLTSINAQIQRVKCTMPFIV